MIVTLRALADGGVSRQIGVGTQQRVLEYASWEQMLAADTGLLQQARRVFVEPGAWIYNQFARSYHPVARPGRAT